VNALATTLTRLQRSFDQQKRFTSDAAHELKTDLAIVKSSLQLLSMKTRSAEEYSRGLALSLDDFTRLESTVQKMLTLARLEQTSKVPGQSSLMQEAIEEAVQQSGAYAELRKIVVAVDAVDSAYVPLDNRDAVLLCSNVLLNALQHSPEGGTVRIDLEFDGARVQLTIRDQGDGIPEEDRQHLFEPFYRGDPSRSRKSGGTGLGLSICQAICRRVAGTIEIANHREGGAIVTVVLPRLAVKEKQALSASIKA
jgi:signal transduction histidine kinase